MGERMTNFFTGLREAWSLAKPYFKSEEKWVAWGLLVFVIALNLIVVAMNVVITYWNNDFYNAIQVYDAGLCWKLLYYPVIHIKGSPLPMLGFAELVAAYVLIATYATYFNQMLQIKWRQWLTAHYVDNWLSDRAYYTISLANDPGRVIDNPDQRISEDLREGDGEEIQRYRPAHDGPEIIPHILEAMPQRAVLIRLAMRERNGLGMLAHAHQPKAEIGLQPLLVE